MRGSPHLFFQVPETRIKMMQAKVVESRRSFICHWTMGNAQSARGSNQSKAWFAGAVSLFGSAFEVEFLSTPTFVHALAQLYSVVELDRASKQRLDGWVTAASELPFL
ncbi:hypothetical protein AKJ16_DCAP26647 [Drosera capensis]